MRQLEEVRGQGSGGVVGDLQGDRELGEAGLGHQRGSFTAEQKSPLTVQHALRAARCVAEPAGRVADRLSRMRIEPGEHGIRLLQLGGPDAGVGRPHRREQPGRALGRWCGTSAHGVNLGVTADSFSNMRSSDERASKSVSAAGSRGSPRAHSEAMRSITRSGPTAPASASGSMSQPPSREAMPRSKRPASSACSVISG